MTPRRDPHSDDQLLTLATILTLGLLGAGLLTGLVLGGALTAQLDGHGWRWRPTGWAHALATLLHDPTHPGRAFGHPDTASTLWWTITGAIELLVLTIVTTLVALAARLLRHDTALATRRQLRHTLGAKAARARAHRARPSLATTAHRALMHEVAVHMGRSVQHRIDLYGQHEDAELVMVGTRQGKTNRRIIPRVLDAPGPVVTTSTKGDVLAATVGIRRQHGPIHVFDPEDVTGWPEPLRWNPITGCHHPDEAIRRARELVAARPLDGTVTNSGFFTDSAARVLRSWLHAAALGHKTMRDILDWAAHWSDDEPIALLQRSPTSAHWAHTLQDLTTNTAGEMLGGIAQTLNLVLDPLNNPRLLDACSPPHGHHFDVENFLRSQGTLYIISEGGVGSAGPLASALALHVHHQAKRLATRYPDGRLDPPLRCPWDEVGNIAAPDNLGQLVSDSGGRGIHLILATQGLGQLHRRWGKDQTREIWNSVTTRLILGGVAEADTLDDLSRLVGDTRQLTTSHNTGDHRHTRSTTYTWERALRIDQLRTLPDGQALLLYRNTPATLVHLDAWYDHPNAAELLTLKHQAEHHMGRTAAS
ncbi:type IV secretory system conjugative DNA transfer family protein [Saccharothrix variisporea]|uniref:TraM-binding TraD/TraG-like protein n=1 Tax=Saccharothrix variisporea TaxID=543527 RepID=A0A495XD07_9PSEU|nr:TraM recognition domain-containing protein [Saccharothrix variisporea]RKT69418.1 TraM-binding TraD/TraG-like protein [Saccharothrix variisporea]